MFFQKEMQNVLVDVTVGWRYGQDPESAQWIGVCPALNLNALGGTIGELLDSANQATVLLFEDLFASGELAAFLAQHGWSQKVHVPPPGSRVRFEVPLEIIPMAASDLRSYANA